MWELTCYETFYTTHNTNGVNLAGILGDARADPKGLVRGRGLGVGNWFSFPPKRGLKRG